MFRIFAKFVRIFFLEKWNLDKERYVYFITANQSKGNVGSQKFNI